MEPCIWRSGLSYCRAKPSADFLEPAWKSDRVTLGSDADGLMDSLSSGFTQGTIKSARVRCVTGVSDPVMRSIDRTARRANEASLRDEAKRRRADEVERVARHKRENVAGAMADLVDTVRRDHLDRVDLVFKNSGWCGHSDHIARNKLAKGPKVGITMGRQSDISRFIRECASRDVAHRDPKSFRTHTFRDKLAQAQARHFNDAPRLLLCGDVPQPPHGIDGPRMGWDRIRDSRVTLHPRLLPQAEKPCFTRLGRKRSKA
jgi:hypothetical protein